MKFYTLLGGLLMNISTIYQILGMFFLICIVYFFVTKIFKLPEKMYAYLNDMDTSESNANYSRKK